MAFETAVADIQLSRVESRNAEKMYNKRSIAEVSSMFEGFDWSAYAKGAGVADLEELVVRQLPYFEAIGGLMAKTDMQTIKDYMTYRLVNGSADLLSTNLLTLKFGFYSKTLRGIPENKPRWKAQYSCNESRIG